MAWLLGTANEAATATERAKTRIDAVRTGLAAGAGAGAAIGLMLAFRRQRTQEIATALTALDAAERRITELYTTAADQLGSDKAPVRLAGLYALERLAQENPGQRQTIVNVICAYLRMPFIPPAEQPASDDQEEDNRREEHQVRQTAQRILAAHLRDERTGKEDPTTYWPDIHLDLSGAHLVQFNLSDCRVTGMQCHHTHFIGETILRGLNCGLAFFQGATFRGQTDFRGITVDQVWFSYATFAREVRVHTDEFYPSTRFGRHADFRGATFTAGARFNGATFAGSVEFSGAKYAQGAETIRLDDVRIEDPNAVSPESSKAPSTWPPGWIIEPSQDGPATLAWRHQPSDNSDTS